MTLTDSTAILALIIGSFALALEIRRWFESFTSAISELNHVPMTGNGTLRPFDRCR